jgi:ABC-type Fe3+-hydroxamate transport system substrate-binding protein
MVNLFNEVLGREVAVPDHPTRVISLSPAITEILFLLGLGDRVIGVSAFCARPDEAKQKRKVGSYSTTNVDQLRELDPDLIFAVTGYQRDLALRLSPQFPVYPLTLPVSVSGIIDMVVKVGLVVGEQDRGWELSSKLAREMASVSPRNKGMRAYVEMDLGGPVSFGAHSYITDVFHLLGASTLFDHVRSEWLTPDLMEVKSANPDVIFYEAKMYSKFGQPDLERLLDKRGWREMSSVRNGSCFLTPGPLDFLAHHGPSFITETIPWLSGKLALAADNLK